MPRYIDEDEFVAWVQEHWCADCQNDNGLRCRACWIDDAIDIVEEAPEADVVPKSEVENLKAIIADHKASEERLEELYSNAKADVAKKIFEEFENILEAMIQLNCAIGVQHEDPIERAKAISAEQALRAFRDYVAELKKKY